MTVLLHKVVFKVVEGLPGPGVPRLHLGLHVDPYDAGALAGQAVQLGPVCEVTPGGQGEVLVVTVCHLLFAPKVRMSVARMQLKNVQMCDSIFHHCSALRSVCLSMVNL